MKLKNCLFCFCLATLLWALPARATIVTVDLGPSQDAEVADGLYANGNYGSSIYLSRNPAMTSTTTTVDLSLIQFDLSSIPSGSTIQSAALKLYIGAARFYYNYAISWYRNTAAWSEATATYNTKPSADATAVSTGIPATTGYFSWDFTIITQAWLDGTYANDGVTSSSMLKFQNPIFYYLQTYSKEASDSAVRPILEVTYGAPVPIPGAALLLGAGLLRLANYRRRKKS
jgi:hypothetical protein